jgi:hypothetical protein
VKPEAPPLYGIFIVCPSQRDVKLITHPDVLSSTNAQIQAVADGESSVSRAMPEQSKFQTPRVAGSGVPPAYTVSDVR